MNDRAKEGGFVLLITLLVLLLLVVIVFEIDFQSVPIFVLRGISEMTLPPIMLLYRGLPQEKLF